MSENHPEPDLPENGAELESLLEKLEPNPLEFGIRKSLERHCEETFLVTGSESAPASLHWHRLIPLALVGALAMLAYVSYHFGPRTAPPSSNESIVIAEPARPGAPAMVSSLEGRSFQPASAQGYFVNSSSGEIAEMGISGESPSEGDLEYRDVPRWGDDGNGDPRFFKSGREEALVPLLTY